MRLDELQRAFSDDVFSAASDSASRVAAEIHGGKLGAAKRLAIYRHNVFSALRGALADLYPVTKAIVGAAFFEAAGDAFIRVTPSLSGDLNNFGAGFADFIKGYAPARELAYLPDVARMEWAWHLAFHAQNARALDLARLAAVPAEAHAQLKFLLHPSSQLMQSVYPLFDIWRVNQPDYAGDMQLNWDQGTEHLLIFRADVEVEMHKLDAGSFTFLSRVGEGGTLEAAAEAALEVDAAFPLQARLAEYVQMGLVVDFS